MRFKLIITILIGTALPIYAATKGRFAETIAVEFGVLILVWLLYGLVQKLKKQEDAGNLRCT